MRPTRTCPAFAGVIDRGQTRNVPCNCGVPPTRTRRAGHHAASTACVSAIACSRPDQFPASRTDGHRNAAPGKGRQRRRYRAAAFVARDSQTSNARNRPSARRKRARFKSPPEQAPTGWSRALQHRLRAVGQLPTITNNRSLLSRSHAANVRIRVNFFSARTARTIVDRRVGIQNEAAIDNHIQAATVAAQRLTTLAAAGAHQTDRRPVAGSPLGEAARRALGESHLFRTSTTSTIETCVDRASDSVRPIARSWRRSSAR